MEILLPSPMIRIITHHQRIRMIRITTHPLQITIILIPTTHPPQLPPTKNQPRMSLPKKCTMPTTPRHPPRLRMIRTTMPRLPPATRPRSPSILPNPWGRSCWRKGPTR